MLCTTFELFFSPEYIYLLILVLFLFSYPQVPQRFVFGPGDGVGPSELASQGGKNL